MSCMRMELVDFGEETCMNLLLLDNYAGGFGM
jgi:hypothetical protein